MSIPHKTDPEEEKISAAESSIDDNSRSSGIDSYSDRNSITGWELSELATHTLLMETRVRDLDREVYQDPDSDRYLVPSETVFDNAADDLETMAVSTFSQTEHRPSRSLRKYSATQPINEKGTSGKNDGNEVVEEGSSSPLDLVPNEVIEPDEDILPYAEEDWQDPEQIEVPKNLEPDLPFTMQTRQSDSTRLTKKYNPY